MPGIAGAALPPLKKYLSVKRNIQQIVSQFGQSDIITISKLFNILHANKSSKNLTFYDFHITALRG